MNTHSRISPIKCSFIYSFFFYQGFLSQIDVLPKTLPKKMHGTLLKPNTCFKTCSSKDSSVYIEE